MLDTVYEYIGLGGMQSRCRLRIFQPTATDLPVVLASELPDNPGTSVTNAAESLAAEFLVRYLPQRDGLEPPFVYVEHYPDRQTEGARHYDRTFRECFSVVEFSHHRSSPQRGPGRLLYRFGSPRWQYRERAAIEWLIGGRLPDPTSEDVQEQFRRARLERLGIAVPPERRPVS